MADRPLDSGRKDALGRTIRISDADTASRSDAPNPPAVDDWVPDYGMTEPGAAEIVHECANKVLGSLTEPTPGPEIVERIQDLAQQTGDDRGVFCDEIIDGIGAEALYERLDSDVEEGLLVQAGETDDGIVMYRAANPTTGGDDGDGGSDELPYCTYCHTSGHNADDCPDTPLGDDQITLPVLPATRRTEKYLRLGGKEMGYEIHSVYTRVNGRAVDAGLNVHTGHVKAHQQWGKKYSVTVPGHHWDGIAQPVTAASKMADINAFCEQHVAAAGPAHLDGRDAWMSTVVNTAAGTATIRVRHSLGNGADRVGAQGYELQMRRDSDGTWTVDSATAGTISRPGLGQSQWYLAENTAAIPTGVIVDWFADQHNQFVDN